MTLFRVRTCPPAPRCLPRHGQDLTNTLCYTPFACLQRGIRAVLFHFLPHAYQSLADHAARTRSPRAPTLPTICRAPPLAARLRRTAPHHPWCSDSPHRHGSEPPPRDAHAPLHSACGRLRMTWAFNPRPVHTMCLMVGSVSLNGRLHE